MIEGNNNEYFINVLFWDLFKYARYARWLTINNQVVIYTFLYVVNYIKTKNPQVYDFFKIFEDDSIF